MLKIGLIGVGGISKTHIAEWKKTEDVELVALCDIRPEQMKNYPEQRHYNSFDEMLKNEQIDILDICLPTYLHAEYSIKAMEHGINVLCEKPISLNEEDVIRIYDFAKKNNVKFMTAHVIRFWPEYMALKKIYDNGIYGKLLSGVMQRIEAKPGWSWDDWMADEKRSGLVPFDLHIHDLDFLIYAFGNPQEESHNRAKDSNQDYINVTYKYDNFFIAVETAWYAGQYPFNAGFRFQFEHAVVAYENWKFSIYPQTGEVINNPNEILNLNNPGRSGYGNEIVYFVECVKKDKLPNIIKPEELLEVLSLLHSLNK